jgi:Flp pilus assembly pilin Flp
MFRKFLNDENGAVTVDWIVLTAAITGLGIGATVSIKGGVDSLAFGIQSSLSGATVVNVGQMGFSNYVRPTLLMMDSVNQQPNVEALATLMENATNEQVLELAHLHAQQARDHATCPGVRSCAMAIDHVALTLTELQNRDAHPNLVAQAQALHTEVRALWD